MCCESAAVAGRVLCKRASKGETSQGDYCSATADCTANPCVDAADFPTVPEEAFRAQECMVSAR